MRLQTLSLICVLTLSGYITTAYAQSFSSPKQSVNKSGGIPIQFRKGEQSSLVVGSLTRAEKRRYILNARAQQNMTVKITSPDNNAVMAIYLPSRRDALPLADSVNNATTWTGSLPESGNYLFVVNSKNGTPTDYSLEVEIK